MILESWAEYIPPPGSEYIVHYVPDRHTSQPDLNAINRALDARPGVALLSVDIEGTFGFVANLKTYVGDQSLLGVLGSYTSDGDNFWQVDYVERVDDGVPNVLGVTIGRVLDAILDPVEDTGTAAAEAARETVQKVKRVGIPTAGLVAIGVGAFLLARTRL